MVAQETFVTNAAETTLSSSLASGATTINVTSSSAFPSVPFYAVIDPDVNASREVILVDGSKTATTFTLTAASKRGQDGTTDTSHSSGAKVVCVPVAALWTDINDRVDATNAAKVSKAGGDTITASAADVKPLVVTGAAGQTANLFEATNEAGTEAHTAVNNLGVLVLTRGLFASGPVAGNVNNAVIQGIATGATNKGLLIQGAPSQTANLAEFQNSAGTVVATINATGGLLFTSADVSGIRALRIGAPDSAGIGWRTVRVAN